MLTHTLSCDGKTCDSFQIVAEDDHATSEWVEVLTDDGDKRWDFCSLWCCVTTLVDYAHPMETVDVVDLMESPEKDTD
jgi:hypothetical protein